MIWPKHDRGGAPKKKPFPATHYSLFIEGIAKSGARSEVVTVVWLPAGVETGGKQCSIGIPNRRRRHELLVVTKPEIEHELRIDSNVVLEKHREVGSVWFRSRSRRTRTGKVLRESRWRVGREVCIRSKRILPAKEPREEIEDAIPF